MEPSVIEEVRLTAYKSFRDAVLPLDDLTVVVGRNGSGKSNALDGLWTLARLASGDDVRDTIDGGREGAAVRGGVAGCAPFGTSRFDLGCTVRTGITTVTLDVSVQTEPIVQIVFERLAQNGGTLLVTDEPRGDSSDIVASWSNQEVGRNPKLSFRADRLLTTQALSRVPATEAGQQLHLAAAKVRAALKAVFVLDPVPHLMRQYVQQTDKLLRRDAENLSAAVADLISSQDVKDLLRAAMGRLNEQEVIDVVTSKSDLGDVMLTLIERFAESDHPVSARILSDGSLRFLAILVALLQAPTVDTMPEHLASEDAVGQTTVVIEELENGLHASQAKSLIALIREQVQARSVRALATAHSPAILDALMGDEHRSVIVCQRGPSGRSTLTRLSEMPNYLDIVSSGGLGQAAEAGRIHGDFDDVEDPLAVLERVLRSGSR